MKQISPSLTSKLRTDSIVERDYIIFSGETTRHYIWFNLYDDCYNNGNFIGTFVMKRIEFTYKDNDLEFKQKEFNAYKEYKLDNGTWESINYGTFIVQSVKPSDTKEEIKVTGYDYGLKFANPYISELDYSSSTITLLQVLQECCTKCGVELATTDFANSGFLVDSNQFDGLSMFGNVVSAVAGISCNFAKIKADNKLYLEFKNETGIIVDVSDYEEFDDKRDTHPYNAVSLGMSGVEGENVTLVDESVEPGKENYLTINDNPFAYTQEKRIELIQAIFDKVNGFGYSSFELDNCMFPQLECGDLIQIRNKEGQLVNTIVLRISYEETNIKLEAPSTISATVTYQNPPSPYDIAKLTQITVDKQNQKIDAIVSTQNEQGETLNQIQIDNENIKSTTSSIQKDLETNYYTVEKVNELIQNAETGLTNTFLRSGGNNLLRNTAPYFMESENKAEYWEGNVKRMKESNSVSGYALLLQNGIITQAINLSPNQYAIKFKYKKLTVAGTCTVQYNGRTIELTEEEGVIETTGIVNSGQFEFKVICDTDNSFEIYDLMLNVGQVAMPWTQNANESTSDTVNISKGITVSSNTSNTLSTMNDDGFKVKNATTSEEVMVATDDGGKFKNIEASRGSVAGVLMQKIGNQTWISGV